MGSAGGKKKKERRLEQTFQQHQLCHCADPKWVWLCQSSAVPVQDGWTRSFCCDVDNKVFSEFGLCPLRGSGCDLFYTSPVLNSEYLLGQEGGKLLNSAGTSECLVTTLQSGAVSPKK